MSTNNIWSLNNKGEIVNECLQRNNKKLYKPDTPFDNSFVPYLIMIFCAMVDGLVFYSLFSKISYNDAEGSDHRAVVGIRRSSHFYGDSIPKIAAGTDEG